LRLGVNVKGPSEALVASVDLNPVGKDMKGGWRPEEANMLARPLRYQAQVDISQLT
jgi:hypothetical protein